MKAWERSRSPKIRRHLVAKPSQTCPEWLFPDLNIKCFKTHLSVFIYYSITHTDGSNILMVVNIIKCEFSRIYIKWWCILLCVVMATVQTSSVEADYMLSNWAYTCLIKCIAYWFDLCVHHDRKKKTTISVILKKKKKKEGYRCFIGCRPTFTTGMSSCVWES